MRKILSIALIFLLKLHSLSDADKPEIVLLKGGKMMIKDRIFIFRT